MGKSKREGDEKWAMVTGKAKRKRNLSDVLFAFVIVCDESPCGELAFLYVSSDRENRILAVTITIHFDTPLCPRNSSQRTL